MALPRASLLTMASTTEDPTSTPINRKKFPSVGPFRISEFCSPHPSTGRARINPAKGPATATSKRALRFCALPFSPTKAPNVPSETGTGNEIGQGDPHSVPTRRKIVAELVCAQDGLETYAEGKADRKG